MSAILQPESTVTSKDHFKDVVFLLVVVKDNHDQLAYLFDPD